MNQKKPNLIKRFMPFMGKKKFLFPLALVLSGLAAVLNALPFVFIWLTIRTLLQGSADFHLSQISPYIWGIGGSAVGGVFIYFLALICSHLAAFQVESGLQKEGIRRVFEMPLGYFDQVESGKIRKVINDGASMTHTFLAHQLPDLTGTLVSPLALLIMIIAIDWRVGLVSLLPIILGIGTIGSMMSGEAKDFMQRYQDALEDMSSEAVGYVRGIPVVKTFGQSVFSFKRFYDSIKIYEKNCFHHAKIWKKRMSFSELIMQSTAFFLVPAAILLIGRGENLSLVLTNFIFYLIISPNFMSIVMKSMYFNQNSQLAEMALDRIEAILAYPELNYREREETLSRHDLEFRDVVFSYEGTEKNAVNGVSFIVREGETVALVGPSGGGKTTIARLAARFWDVSSGSVLIGGVDVRDMSKEDLMSEVSFVFQNTKLFSMSLRDNICLGVDNPDPKGISRAVDLSQSRDIIEGLPNGLDTVIGTKGTYLSGGEQQRISLARAILKDAPIVLLDEATAFADPENEHLIQKGLKELSKGKTTLMIAHRLTSVRNVDRILVIQDGKIAEEGTHHELMDRGGIYKKMYDEYSASISWQLTAVKPVLQGGAA